MNRKLILLLALVTAVVISLLVLPVQAWFAEFLSWTQLNPGKAWVAFIAVYITSTVCFLPALPLTLAGGAIFGLTKGFLLVSLASTLGATAAFYVGRTLAREWVSRRIEAWPAFRALDGSLRQRGFWIVMLTRLSPLFPYFLLNYAYGVSAVRGREYVPATWLGMMPATLAYVYAGSLAADLAKVLTGQVQLGDNSWILLGIGLLATIAVTILVTRLARRELSKELVQ